MYKECKTEKALQRRIMIEECLIRQMRSREYEQIHVSDICRLAGISRSTFYRFFDTKTDILNAYLDRVIQSFGEPGQMSFLFNDALTEGTRHFIRYWYENREIMGLLIKQNMFDLLIRKAVRIAYRNERILSIVAMNDDATALHRSVIFSAYGIVGLMFDWQKRGFIESEDELTEILMGLLLKPLYRPERIKAL